LANRRLNLNYSAPRGEASGFRLEAEHLAQCAQSRDRLLNAADLGLRDVQTLEEILTASSDAD
jgi:hypothetical protein